MSSSYKNGQVQGSWGSKEIRVPLGGSGYNMYFVGSDPGLLIVLFEELTLVERHVVFYLLRIRFAGAEQAWTAMLPPYYVKFVTHPPGLCQVCCPLPHFMSSLLDLGVSG